MASSMQTLPATMILLSLLLECAEKVSGMRYIPNSSNDTEIKHSDFLVNLASQPSGLIPDLRWFLLPPNPKPFHFYKIPIAAAAPTTFSYGIPAPNSGYEASSPSSREDQVPEMPQP